jgi:uncharacterized protein YuzE
VKIEYDSEADAAYVRLLDTPSVRTVEESDVCIIDLDAAGKPVAIELLSVFGFAGASLRGLVTKGLITEQLADQLLKDLRCELIAA